MYAHVRRHWHTHTATHTYMHEHASSCPAPPPWHPSPLVPSAASASVTYLHEAGTKWKFVAALLIAIGRQPPSADPTSPATPHSPTPGFPSPHPWLSHM